MMSPKKGWARCVATPFLGYESNGKRCLYTVEAVAQAGEFRSGIQTLQYSCIPRP